MNRISRIDSRAKGGFTLLELFIVIVLLGVLLCMFLPTTRGVRDAARRTDCANRVRQIAIATHNFHDAYKHLPSAMGSNEIPGADSQLSGFVVLSQFMEMEPVWSEISKPQVYDGTKYSAFPSPWSTGYEPWQLEIEQFRCPSDNTNDSGFGDSSYAFCIGDMARSIHSPNTVRGMFAVGKTLRLETIPDGTSNTIAFTENCVRNERSTRGQFAINQPKSMLDDPSECLRLTERSGQLYSEYIQISKEDREMKNWASGTAVFSKHVQLSKEGRGSNWASGTAESTLVNTILPPGSASAAIGGSRGVDGIYSANSRHTAGINCAYADGSVHNITRRIDAGDPSHPTPTQKEMSTVGHVSPYGVWGALGCSNDGAATGYDAF